MFRSLIKGALIAGAAALGSQASAAVTLLTAPSAINTTYLNMFEGTKNSGPVTFDAGSFIATANGFAGNVTSSGTRGLASGGYVPGVISASLSSSFNQVGFFFGNDDTCCRSSLNPVLAVYSGSTLLGSVSIAANMNDFADQFIGLQSDTAFDRVTISYDHGLYVFIDDFRLGTSSMNSAVPEPATWAMMLIGFGAVGYSMRRRNVGYKALQSA